MFNLRKVRRALNSLRILVPCAAFVTCGVPSFDYTTVEGKNAIIDEVNIALTKGNCGKAIDLIEGVYNSKYTDNTIRLLRASAHACNTKVNFFDLVEEFAEDPTGLVGPFFWMKMTELFPSTFDDTRLESGFAALDALQAVLKSGVYVTGDRAVNEGTYNVGSVHRDDREDDANTLLLFVSMAVIGDFQNRYGYVDPRNPDSTYFKEKSLYGEDPSDVDENACGYAGGILNLIDAMDVMVSDLSGSFQTAIQSISNFLKRGAVIACEKACTGAAGFATGCTLSTYDCNPLCPVDMDTLDANPSAVDLTNCIPCPLELRDRTNCTDSTVSITKNKAACAAAGLITYVNDDPNDGARSAWPCVVPGC